MTSAAGPAMRVYGAPWWPHCRRAKKLLPAHRIAYNNVDIDGQPDAIERLKELQSGGQWYLSMGLVPSWARVLLG